MGKFLKSEILETFFKRPLFRRFFKKSSHFFQSNGLCFRDCIILQYFIKQHVNTVNTISEHRSQQKSYCFTIIFLTTKIRYFFTIKFLTMFFLKFFNNEN